MNLPVLPAQPIAPPTAAPYVFYLIPAAIAVKLALYGWRRQLRAAGPFSLLLLIAAGMLIFCAALRARFLGLVPVALPELLAHMPDGLVVLDHRGVVTACNDAAPHLLATPQRDWNGREFLDVIAGSPLEIDLRALLAPPIAAATRHLTYERADGVRAVELRLRPLYADGTHAGALLVVRDQTDRAQLEQAREQQVHELSVLNQLARAANSAIETDELLRTITRELVRVLPSARMVIGLLQPDGTTLRLVVDEPRHTASTLEGHAMTEYDVRKLQDILRAGQPRVISAADPELARTPAQAILQHEGVRTVLVVPLASLATPLGAMFVGYTGQRAIAPNEVQLFASVGELVSEAIARTRHAEEMKEASRDKSTLLATVSHELRTPLSSIIGFIDMLEQGFFGELPERMHEPLARMRHSSSALLRLINDILDFSKMAAGYLAIDLEPVDLAPLIRDVVGALQPQIQERGLALTVAIAPDLPQVQANSARLAQILTNLIANAIKFTERGSITVRAMDDGERVRFSVADTGIGIAPEQLRILFQEFRQIENEHTRRNSGTGLGLAISQQLMQLMGGTLTVESTPGVGSTFYGEVPIVPKSLQEKQRGVTSR
jgi:PAS domain S-box-containing protein